MILNSARLIIFFILHQINSAYDISVIDSATKTPAGVHQAAEAIRNYDAYVGAASQIRSLISTFYSGAVIPTDLAHELTMLENQIATLTTHVVASPVANLIPQLTSASASIEPLITGINKSATTKGDITTQLATATAQLTAVQSSATSLIATFNTILGTTTVPTGSDLSSQLDVLNEQVTALKAADFITSGTAQTLATALLSGVNIAAPTVGDVVEQIQSASVQLTSAQTTTTSLIGQISSAASTTGDLHTQLSTAAERLLAAQSEADALISALNTTLGTATTPLSADLAAKVKILETQINTLSSKLLAAQTNVTSLQGQLASTQASATATHGLVFALASALLNPLINEKAALLALADAENIFVSSINSLVTETNAAKSLAVTGTTVATNAASAGNTAATADAYFQNTYNAATSSYNFDTYAVRTGANPTLVSYADTTTLLTNYVDGQSALAHAFKNVNLVPALASPMGTSTTFSQMETYLGSVLNGLFGSGGSGIMDPAKPGLPIFSGSFGSSGFFTSNTSGVVQNGTLLFIIPINRISLCFPGYPVAGTGDPRTADMLDPSKWTLDKISSLFLGATRVMWTG